MFGRQRWACALAHQSCAAESVACEALDESQSWVDGGERPLFQDGNSCLSCCYEITRLNRPLGEPKRCSQCFMPKTSAISLTRQTESVGQLEASSSMAVSSFIWNVHALFQ